MESYCNITHVTGNHCWNLRCQQYTPGAPQVYDIIDVYSTEPGVIVSKVDYVSSHKALNFDIHNIRPQHWEWY